MIQGSMGTIFGELKLPEAAGPIPLVILCHGFGGTLEGNRDYADTFRAAGFATYSFDFCGGSPFSKSEGKMVDMTVLTEAADLNAVIDHFLPDPRFSRICLWGGSQGGFVSAYVASGRPKDIDRAVLEFPAIVLQDDARKRADANGQFPPTSNVMGHTIGRVYNETAVSFDLYDLLAACDIPVLILHGDEDGIVPLSYSERAVKTFPNARLIVMPGQGHGFTGESRDKAKDLETAFLSGKAE